MSDAVSDAQPQSSLAYGWLTVGLLTIAYVFSFIDRYVLGLLIEPIKADLGLTDTQIGLLLGPAFAIFYATMGLPLGWLADRKNRVKIVAVGIAVWSIATAASGLARNFTHLFIARMSIGVGEATLAALADIAQDHAVSLERAAKLAVSEGLVRTPRVASNAPTLALDARSLRNLGSAGEERMLPRIFWSVA